jgi:hypothetical protein
MGRNRGKFSFPMPGRRTQKQAEQDDGASSIPSIPSTPSMPEWSSRSRLDEPSSKAHRLLGTSDTIHRTTTKMPTSPGYMSITVSEASFGSEIGDKASRTATDYNGLHVRPDMSRRSSSNVMGRTYSNDGRRGSDQSTASHLQPQTSDSTLRSHYDPKSSPLSISQQTSNSAVRDMALRRGKPQVVTNYNNYTASPISPVIMDETRRKENRKSKPARLDLSKLFPKPKGGAGPDTSNALFSPTKIVNSPAAMSMTSDYFPRPMTREPTPNPRGQVRLKTTSRRPGDMPLTPSSPVRQFQRDQYDNGKIHVRRPPKGVQHWFDALDDDSDEALEHVAVPIFAPTAVHPVATPKGPLRRIATSQARPDATPPHQALRKQHLKPMVTRHDTFTHDDLVDVNRLNSPSQFSLASTKTKESTLSKSNLQDSSILSFSSSEDEDEDSHITACRVVVRRSLDIDDASDIVIGQAQAFEVRPHRRPSAGGVSTLSTSTNAATIQVMYSPEPTFLPSHYPRSSHFSGSRRSTHIKQPSVIHEDEDIRPNTAVNMPLSPSTYSAMSARTSASEPKPQTNGEHKLMAVTAEEEALLELMRRKRASMAKKNTTPAELPTEERNKRHKTPPKIVRSPYRTSGFLAEASPVRVAEAMTTRKESAIALSPLLLSPRGRQRNTDHSDNEQSQLRDSSASDAWSEHHNRETLPHHIPTPSEFSPIDLFSPASLIPTASCASPSTTNHPTPPLSPITPGLRTFESDIHVKVANSDTSNDSDEVIAQETGIIDTIPNGVKSPKPANDISAHRRRRTASSGAAISLITPTANRPADVTLDKPSSTDPAGAKLPQKSDKRMSRFILSTDGNSRSRHSSSHSSSSQQSLQSRSSSTLEKKLAHRVSSRQSRAMGIPGDAYGQRDSVSNDVLAAWGDLGGTY